MYGLAGHTEINRTFGVVYRMEKMKNHSRKLNMEMISVIMALAWPTMLEQLMQTGFSGNPGNGGCRSHQHGKLAYRQHYLGSQRGVSVFYRQVLRGGG